MSKEELIPFLKNVPVFEGLRDEEYETIISALIPKNFSKGETIVFEEDSESSSFFLIGSGNVSVVVITPEGRQTILATLKKGEFFGEMALLDGEPRSASVVAAEDCRLYMLNRVDFMRLLQRHPDIPTRMLVEMSKRLRHSNRQINSLSMMSAYGRVADVLMQMADDSGRKKDDTIVIEPCPTHKTISEMACTTRETVSRVFSRLRKQRKIITDRKRMVIIGDGIL